MDGTIRVFLAEALILPTGLLTLAFLTRRLGTTNYGLFALAATTIAWIEWSLATLSGRAINKCVSKEADWRPVATAAVRVHLVASVALAGSLILSAGLVAKALGEPALAAYLRLYALDIPLFSLAHAHRNILVGIGGYRQRAWLSASRWLSRLALIVVFVSLGLSVRGCIAAVIGASLIELIIARRFIRPSFWRPSGFPVRRLLTIAFPLFLLGICLRLFERIDLFILKGLGASAAEAGVYAAAQNLSVVPGLFAQSFSPLLLSTLMRLLRDGQEQHARDMARDSLRLVILLVPFAAMVCGAAPDIVRLVAGAQFTGAAPLLRPLIFATLASLLISVTNAILIAADRSWWSVAVGAAMLLVAVAGQYWAIPQWGARGAASVTAASAWLAATIAVALATVRWKIALPRSSVARCAMVSGGAYLLAVWWPAAGAFVVLKLIGIAACIVIGYLALGEFDARERALAWSLIPWRQAANPG